MALHWPSGNLHSKCLKLESRISKISLESVFVPRLHFIVTTTYMSCSRDLSFFIFVAFHHKNAASARNNRLGKFLLLSFRKHALEELEEH